ncbi:hypothetical protein [Noviherbaspirillum pedocola]|uniref:Uncharacterized protein n=1 Tax=Noviherbaspirillum pedocola TaxID=2801341 RepID=A0A934W7G0_9BURK|nr:hypothetical protein [Noviherbaspirillum pedocola]MBK4735538.1 hypothetical protein [Noviherbaspirillum pedocola]
MDKVDAFNRFVSERKQCADWGKFIALGKKRLSRVKLCASCKFSRSTLYQDKAIERMLRELEADLKASGILLPGAEGATFADGGETPTSLEDNLAALERRLDLVQTNIENLSPKLASYAKPRDDYPLD